MPAKRPISICPVLPPTTGRRMQPKPSFLALGRPSASSSRRARSTACAVPGSEMFSTAFSIGQGPVPSRFWMAGVSVPQAWGMLYRLSTASPPSLKVSAYTSFTPPRTINRAAALPTILSATLAPRRPPCGKRSNRAPMPRESKVRSSLFCTTASDVSSPKSCFARCKGADTDCSIKVPSLLFCLLYPKTAHIASRMRKKSGRGVLRCGACSFLFFSCRMVNVECKM